MVLIGFFSCNKSQNNIRHEIFNSNNIFLNLTVSQLNNYFEERTEDGKAISSAKDVYGSLRVYQEKVKDSGEWKSCYAVLDKFLLTVSKSYTYNNIYLTDASGKTVYSTSNKDRFASADLSKRDL